MRTYENRIAELRHAAGLSLEALAERVNSNRQTVHDVEIGRTGLTLAWMRRLARVFDVAPADILLDEDKPYVLTEEELAIIMDIRALPSDRRGIVRGLIHSLGQSAAA